MAKGLNVHLNQVVQRVAYDDANVMVSSGDKQYQAEFAILTVPLGVLKDKRIHFVPALPKAKNKSNSCYRDGAGQ